METLTAKTGFISAFTEEKVNHQSNNLWRPWARKEDLAVTHTLDCKRGSPNAKHPKTLQVTHPVKLFWPKSKCFDYLYQDAEMLLRNYPVQATICLYEDSSADEDSEDEEDEVEKDQN